MGLFKLFGSKEKAPGAGVAGRIAALFEERTAVDTVRLRPVREACAPWESKLGGVPYLPEGFPYPHDRREGRENVPLRFLAQLNFGEMPALEGFPGRGILQFYIGNDEQHGIDYETMTAQKAFRAIYHEEVAASPDASPGVLPGMPEGEELVKFPFDGELRLRFEKERRCMGGDDFRFDGLLLQYHNEVNAGHPVRSLDRVPEELLDEVYERLQAEGHRVGGYPGFAQLDPRAYHEYLREHTVLLFQLGSETTDDYSIAWGDAGSCHFFIRPDDLAACDFAEVAYSWDCY